MTYIGVTNRSLAQANSFWYRYEAERGKWLVQIDEELRPGDPEICGVIRLYRAGDGVARMTGQYVGRDWTKITWFQFPGTTGVNSYALRTNRWVWEPCYGDRETPAIPRTEIMRAVVFLDSYMTNRSEENIVERGSPLRSKIPRYTESKYVVRR